jgi:hypothetical protein
MQPMQPMLSSFPHIRPERSPQLSKSRRMKVSKISVEQAKRHDHYSPTIHAAPIKQSPAHQTRANTSLHQIMNNNNKKPHAEHAE